MTAIVAAFVVTFVARPLLRPSVRDGVQREMSNLPSRKLASNSRTVAMQEAELNHGLPAMLDSQTMLTRVEADPTSTTYYITMVNVQSAYLDHEFLMDAQELVGRRNCLDSDIAWAYDNGLQMKYVVSGSDNRQVGSFIISRAYCQRFRLPVTTARPSSNSAAVSTSEPSQSIEQKAPTPTHQRRKRQSMSGDLRACLTLQNAAAIAACAEKKAPMPPPQVAPSISSTRPEQQGQMHAYGTPRVVAAEMPKRHQYSAAEKAEHDRLLLIACAQVSPEYYKRCLQSIYREE